MPRYVILTHDHPFPHWDLMLEQNGRLRTWRLLSEPAIGSVVPAEPLPDHRLDYLTYEGPVSGGRGTVARWDAGEYAIRPATDVRLGILLRGQRGNLTATLHSTGDAHAWEFGATRTGPAD